MILLCLLGSTEEHLKQMIVTVPEIMTTVAKTNVQMHWQWWPHVECEATHYLEICSQAFFFCLLIREWQAEDKALADTPQTLPPPLPGGICVTFFRHSWLP